MRKPLKFLTLFLAAGLLASCNGGSLPYSTDDVDTSIETPYVDYTVPVTKISFPEEEKSISLLKGETHDYSFTLEPKRAEAKGVSWVSENTDIVTIDIDPGPGMGFTAGKALTLNFNNLTTLSFPSIASIIFSTGGL